MTTNNNNMICIYRMLCITFLMSLKSLVSSYTKMLRYFTVSFVYSINHSTNRLYTVVYKIEENQMPDNTPEGNL